MITTPRTSAWSSDANNDLIGLVSSFLGPAAAAAAAADDDTDAQSSSPEFKTKTSCVEVGEFAVDDCVKCINQTLLFARVIVFSKDRPWQLKQLLRSLQIAGKGSNQSQRLLGKFDVYIIVRASTPSFSRGYNSLIKEHDDILHFLVENDQSKETSFSSLLLQALTADGDGGEHSNGGIVMFLTDDCLLLEPLESILVCAAGAMTTNPFVYNFISRLHLGITWSQTRGVACSPPWNELQYHSLSGYLRYLTIGEGDEGGDNYREGVYLYNRKHCSGEWSYPFDLSGGIYRHGDVFKLLSHMSIEQRNHPNILEMRANQLIEAASAKNGSVHNYLDEYEKPMSAIPTRPHLIILAINRVQDLFQAPLATPKNRYIHTIHDAVTGLASDTVTYDTSDPVSLLRLLDTDYQLDIDRYRSNVYNSTHIGDFFITKSKGNACKEMEYSTSTPKRPKISVLIPVHQGPPHAASHCIISVIMQVIDEYNEFHSIWEGDKSFVHYAFQREALLSSMQIVIVDDRCDDGSIDAMIQSYQDVLISHGQYVSFTIREHRIGGASKKIHSHSRNPYISLFLDIVQSRKPGIACALNTGLNYCDAEIVARMDADDICAPKRLSTQLKFMYENPEFSGVGTSAVLFSVKANPTHCSDATLPYAKLVQNLEPCFVLRPSLTISDSGFLAWTMYFSCTLSHPTVVFRKESIQELAGYDESVLCCEDYDLWLRLLGRSVRSFASLPRIGLWHRKHDKSSSSARSLTQKSEADKACCRAMQRLFHSTNDHIPLEIEHVRILRNPSSAKSSSSLDCAANLLVRLESSFLQVNCEHLTQQEVSMINLDCSQRIGEMATILVTKVVDGSISPLENGENVSESFAWKLWCERCPLDQLKRLCLLCQITR